MRISKVNLARVALVVCLAIQAWGQGARQVSPYSAIEEKDGDHPQAREQWFARGRTIPGESAAQLRYRAQQQKLQLRSRRAAALASAPMGTLSTTAWVPLGPAPLASDAGTGQDYNWVSGRATAVAIDPADASGNTVFVGGAHGGVWKSTNAGSANTNPASVTWSAVADDAATLAVGAIAIQPCAATPCGRTTATSLVLVGTGEPNSSADSYYGLGILRSADGGGTWNLIAQSSDTTPRSFAGLGFSKIAFSTANPQVVVAAAAGASEGVQEGLENPPTVNRGIYVSSDAGLTWKYASIKDGASTVAPGSVTSVVFNAKAGAFFAAVRYHGIYTSTDGMNWNRLADANQPGAGLALAQCPTSPSSSSCPMYRAELTVVPLRNEMYTWVVSLNALGSEVDGGIWQSMSAGTLPWTALNDAGITACGDAAGCGVSQGTYNLELLALPNNSTTDLYAGAINVYKCTFSSPATPSSCSFLNLTHVYGSCASLERVHPDQHHLAGVVASGKELLYFANDGGIYRALDGYTGLTSGSCGPNQFDSLNQTLGSMTQFVSISLHPTDSATILGGTQDNGSPATSAATGTQWINVHAGDGGYNAILPNSPADWFASYPDTGGGTLEIDHCANGINCNTNGFVPTVTSGNLGGDDGAFYFPFMLDPQAPTELLVGTCRIWRVVNATSPTAYLSLSPNFEPTATLPCTGSEVNVVRAIAASGPKDANGFSKVIYAGTDGFGPILNSTPSGGRVFVTKDASVTSPVFSEVEGTINPQHFPVSSIAADSSDSSGQTAYAGIMGFHVSHVFKTTNAGASWTDFTGSGTGALPDAPVNSLLIDASAGMVYAGTDVGVFASPTAAASWTELGPTGGAGFLPNVPVTALQLFSNSGVKLLRASTYGRGVWEYNLVTTPNYTINIANSPLTVFSPQTGSLTGSVISLAGYSSSVTLSCAAGTGAGGTNPPSTCTPQPSTVTPTITGSAFQVSVGGTAGDYSFNIDGVGADASQITHAQAATVHVVSFGMTGPSPASISVAQGATSNAVTITLSVSGSFNGQVSLSCGGLPAGASCNFSPPSPVTLTGAGSSPVSLTISTGPGTPTGASTVVVSGTATMAGASSTQTVSLALTVAAPAPDYALAISNSPQSANVNQGATFQGTLTSLNGYASPVNLSCGTNPPPTCTVSPSAVTPTSAGAAFTVTVQSNAVQTYNFAILGAGTDAAHVAHAANATFNSLFTFTLTDSTGSQSALAGQSVPYTLVVTPPNGVAFPSAVNFACSGLPTGATCSAPPIAAGGSGPQSATLTITTLGPNGTVMRPMARTRVPRMPFVAWVSVAGLVLGGWSQRKECKGGSARAVCVIGLIALALVMTSCGGGGSGGGGSGGGGVTISVNPFSKTLFPTQQQQFTATVAGTTNNGVSWAVSSGPGTVDANGLYTAPPSVTSTTQATVLAVAVADVTKSASAAVTIQAPTPSGSYTVTVTATSGSATQSTTALLNVQ